MLTGLAFGLGVGAGIQAWRNWPATATMTQESLALIFVLGILAAYFGGRSRGRGASASATATATATAASVASNSVNVAVFAPGSGAGSHASHTFPTDAAPWITASPRAELTADQLEGFDLEELIERDTEST